MSNTTTDIITVFLSEYGNTPTFGMAIDLHQFPNLRYSTGNDESYHGFDFNSDNPLRGNEDQFIYPLDTGKLFYAFYQGDRTYDVGTIFKDTFLQRHFLVDNYVERLPKPSDFLEDNRLSPVLFCPGRVGTAPKKLEFSNAFQQELKEMHDKVLYFSALKLNGHLEDGVSFALDILTSRTKQMHIFMAILDPLATIWYTEENGMDFYYDKCIVVNDAGKVINHINCEE